LDLTGILEAPPGLSFKNILWRSIWTYIFILFLFHPTKIYFSDSWWVFFPFFVCVRCGGGNKRDDLVMGNNSPLVKTSSRQSIFQMDMWLFKEEKSIWMRWYHVTAGPFFLILILWFLYNFWQKKTKKKKMFSGL
jgi:hypothetical protein